MAYDFDNVSKDDVKDKKKIWAVVEIITAVILEVGTLGK